MPASTETKPRPSHRDELLAGALVCLREKGYARTTTRDLVAASGTNLGSIVYHFGTKEALLNEAIADGFRSWTAAVEDAAFAAPGDDVIGRLETSLEAMVGRFEELRPLLVAFVEALPQAVRSDELRQTMAAAYEDAREAGARMIQRALGAGDEQPAPEMRVFASVLMALCDGLMLQWLVDPERTPQADEVVAAFTAFAAVAAAGGEQ